MTASPSGVIDDFQGDKRLNQVSAESQPFFYSYVPKFMSVIEAFEYERHPGRKESVRGKRVVIKKKQKREIRG